jgi:4,5-dihydroxyphthalate decarboxylase
VQLKTVIRTTPLVAALKDGRVEPEGFTLAFEEVEPITRGMRIMCREVAFDVCEMAITTYLVARDHGKPFTALPVFLTRGLHHGKVWAQASGDPKSLEGQRVGINRGYTVTTGVWARGILATEYGVDLDKVTWARSDDEHVLEFVPPPNVDDLGEGEDLTDLPFIVGDLTGGDHVPLIADADDAAERALRRGLWPVNHTLVVKDELLAAHPDLGRSLLVALDRAKELYLASGELEPLHARVREITGSDPMPYGVEPNRAVLEQLLDHVVAQKIVRRRPSVDELFRHI